MIAQIPWPLSVPVRKEPLLWVAAGLMSFLAFFLLTFPYRALQGRILSEMTQVSGWNVRAADWSVGFPLAVEWHDMLFSKTDSVAIPVESMRVGVGLLAQMLGQQKIETVVQFPGSAQAGNGRLSATITASQSDFTGTNELKGHAQLVDLALIIKPYVIKGVLQADIAQRWQGTGPGNAAFKGEGTWKAEIKDLGLDRIPIGSAMLPSLTFTKVTLSLICHDTVCDVAEGRGEGPDGTLTAQGKLTLHAPFQQTNLDLALTVQAGPGWAQKAVGLPIPPLPPGIPLTVKLVGPVANPRLSM